MLINIKDLMNISDEQIHEEIKSVVMGNPSEPPQTKSMKAEFNFELKCNKSRSISPKKYNIEQMVLSPFF